MLGLLRRARRAAEPEPGLLSDPAGGNAQQAARYPAGVPVHIVSARLGHANPAITVNVYAHCLPRAQQAAGAVLAGMSAQKTR